MDHGARHLQVAALGHAERLTQEQDERIVAVDAGIWITFYDLPEAGRDEHLDWAHKTYMPLMMKRPGVLWGAHYKRVDSSARRTNTRDTRVTVDDPAVPRGDQYLMIFGAEYADVFGKPVPSKFHASLPDADRKMLAQRGGERMNIFAEAGRVEGPDAPGYKAGMNPTPCIQVGNYNTPWQDEEEMLSFYSEWRMPAMGRTPGCVRIRKLASVSGWAKHGIFYEFSSLEARNQNFIGHEDGHPDMKAWGDKVTKKLVHAPGSSTLATRIWPAI
jgi:hypothetical protein